MIPTPEVYSPGEQAVTIQMTVAGSGEIVADQVVTVEVDFGSASASPMTAVPRALVLAP